MSHEPEDNDHMVVMLELVRGEGYMAPGGPGNIAKLLEGTKPAGSARWRKTPMARSRKMVSPAETVA